MKIPIVNHKDYLAEINEDNKFPINKFDELAKYLIKKNYVNEFYKCNRGVSGSNYVARCYRKWSVICMD